MEIFADPTVLMDSAMAIARNVRAVAVVSFLKKYDCESEIPIVWVEDMQLDFLQGSDANDLRDISQKHLMDIVVQMHLCSNYREGIIVGVMPHMIMLHDLSESVEIQNACGYGDIADAEVISSVLRLALELAVEGREGRKIGTAFIIGNAQEIFTNSHQAIINPYKGQSPEDCDIRCENNWESVKEFAQLDGVFVIDSGGQIASAGRFLNINTGTISLPGGMGGRHLAAAAITLDLPVIGITVSESGGIVRIFRDGRCIQTIRADIRMMK